MFKDFYKILNFKIVSKMRIFGIGILLTVIKAQEFEKSCLQSGFDKTQN